MILMIEYVLWLRLHDSAHKPPEIHIKIRTMTTRLSVTADWYWTRRSRARSRSILTAIIVMNETAERWLATMWDMIPTVHASGRLPRICIHLYDTNSGWTIAPTPKSEIARLHNKAFDVEFSEVALYKAYSTMRLENTATMLKIALTTQSTVSEIVITSLSASRKKMSKLLQHSCTLPWLVFFTSLKVILNILPVSKLYILGRSHYPPWVVPV